MPRKMDLPLLTMPEHATPPVSLFSKAGVFMLYIGMIALFFVTQLLGIYLFAPVVIEDSSLDRAQLFLQGSFNGTVTSYAMIFTLFVLLVVSYGLVKRKLKLSQSQLAQGSITCSSSNSASIPTVNDSQQISETDSSETPHIETTQSYRVADYLAIKPFALHVATGIIGLWLAFVISSEVLTYVLDRDPTAFVDGLYDSTNPKWLLIFAMVVVAPIYEEVIFRGLLWSAIAEQFDDKKGVWMASLVTSIIFALVHLQYEFYEMSVIFVLALLLSFARARSDSLLLPIFIHIINNGAAMWLYLMLQ